MTQLDVYNCVFDMDDTTGMRDRIRVMLGATLETHGLRPEEVRELFLLTTNKTRNKEARKRSFCSYRTKHLRFLETSVVYGLIYAELQPSLEAFAGSRFIKKLQRKDYQKVTLFEIEQQTDSISRSPTLQGLLKRVQKRRKRPVRTDDVHVESESGSQEVGGEVQDIVH